MGSIYTLLWHEYKYCTKCLSEVFRIAQFGTYFLKKFLGEDHQTPLSLVFSKGVFYRNSYKLYKMSPRSVLLHPLFSSLKSKKKKKNQKKKKKKKIAGPLFWNPGSATVDYMAVLVQASSKATWSWSASPLIVGQDSYNTWTLARVQTIRNIAYCSECHYIFWYNVL